MGEHDWNLPHVFVTWGWWYLSVRGLALRQPICKHGIGFRSSKMQSSIELFGQLETAEFMEACLGVHALYHAQIYINGWHHSSPLLPDGVAASA